MPKKKTTYNPDFVKKIRKSKKQAKQGKTKTIKIEYLWK